jgi:hypothetical protein
MTVKSFKPLSYVAEGELEAEADGELEGVFEVEAEGDVDGVFDTEEDGVADTEDDEITVPTLPSSTSQRKTPAETVTEMNDRKSLASANVACVSKATFMPPVTVTTASPPPSVFKRSVKRTPGFVGLASVRVSPEAPVTISQICRSAPTRMIFPLPGSVMIFGPR